MFPTRLRIVNDQPPVIAGDGEALAYLLSAPDAEDMRAHVGREQQRLIERSDRLAIIVTEGELERSDGRAPVAGLDAPVWQQGGRYLAKNERGEIVGALLLRTWAAAQARPRELRAEIKRHRERAAALKERARHEYGELSDNTLRDAARHDAQAGELGRLLVDVVCGLYVHPHYRRRGIARRLLDHALARSSPLLDVNFSEPGAAYFGVARPAAGAR
jgi:ribosomal protein S18 acetylase RimI-like enzyme